MTITHVTEKEAALQREVEQLKEDAITYKRMHCACVFDGDTNTEQCKLHNAWCDTLHEQADYRRERDQLRAELADAQADAARYRWLKNNCGFGIRRNGVYELTVAFYKLQPDYIGDLDTAIDKAIQGETK